MSISLPTSFQVSTLRKFVAFCLLIAVGTTLALHAYLGSYTRLMADDFCSINTSHQLGVLQQVWFWFRNWGGRYSVSLTDSFVFKTLGDGAVRIAPMLILLVWIVAASLASQKILKNESTRDPGAVFPIVYAMIAVFTTLGITPAVTKTLYWWNGMRTYIPALVIFTSHIGFLYFVSEKSRLRKNTLLWSLFSFVGALMSGGFNESFTVFQVLFFTGLMGTGLMTRKLRFGDSLFACLLAGLFASALALTIMLISPGAAIRRSYFPPSPGLFTLLQITLESYMKYMLDIVHTREKIAALLGMVFFSAWIGAELKRERRDVYLIMISAGGGILLSFASLLPSVYGTSQMPAARTFIIPTYILVASLGYAGFLAGQILADIPKLEYVSNFTLLCSVIFLSLSAWLNARLLYNDRNTYITFAQKWDQVDAMIEQAKLNGEESVTIPALDNWAFLDRPNQNPKFWATTCYSEYYGIQVYGPPYK